MYLIRIIHIEYVVCSKHYPLKTPQLFFPLDRKVLCATCDAAFLRVSVCMCVSMYVCFREWWDLRKFSDSEWRNWVWRGLKKKTMNEEETILRNVKGEKSTEQIAKKQTKKNRNATTHKILRIHAERIAREKDDLWRKKRVFLIRKGNVSSISLPLSFIHVFTNIPHVSQLFFLRVTLKQEN